MDFPIPEPAKRVTEYFDAIKRENAETMTMCAMRARATTDKLERLLASVEGRERKREKKRVFQPKAMYETVGDDGDYSVCADDDS